MYKYQPDIVAKTKIPGHIFVDTSFTSKFVPPAIFLAIQTLLLPMIYFKGNWNDTITILYVVTYLVPATTAILGRWYYISRVLHAPFAYLTVFILGYAGGINAPVEFMMIGGICIWGIIYWAIMGAGLSDPLKRSLEVLEKIKSGDLTSEVILNFPRKDELGMVSNGINAMLNKLIDIIDNVQNAAQQVVSGSEQLSTGAAQISEGSAQQAASIEQISATMEEMNSTIAMNADNAQKTASIAARVAESVNKGEQSVKATVRAMKEISSKILVIEEIVRETNMLALNAAIEASKAGEYGRGFAIVSSEIRKLSDRSQRAAKEISALTDANSEKVEDAGKQLEEMVSGIRKTSELIQEISVASTEQAHGISQINEAIQQLDIALQQNVSTSEELASCSANFAGQAEYMSNMASFFKLPDIKKEDTLTTDKQFEKMFEKFMEKERERLFEKFKKDRAFESPAHFQKNTDSADLDLKVALENGFERY